MEGSKKFMDGHGGSFIRFEFDSPLTVKLLKDKEVKIKNQFGSGDIDGMRYLVEVNGEQTTFQTGAFTLISALARCNEGDVVTITKVHRGAKTAYTVKRGEEDVSTAIDGEEENKESKGGEEAEVAW